MTDVTGRDRSVKQWIVDAVSRTGQQTNHERCTVNMTDFASVYFVRLGDTLIVIFAQLPGYSCLYAFIHHTAQQTYYWPFVCLAVAFFHLSIHISDFPVSHNYGTCCAGEVPGDTKA